MSPPRRPHPTDRKSSGAERKDEERGERFEPRMVAFLCNWCSYAGADKAGASQISYPPNMTAIRTMCTGRIDPQFVVKAFDEGADGVLILGCHPGDCHYKEQNLRMIQRHRLLLGLLGQLNIEESRCRLDFVSAAEGEKFSRVVSEMVRDLEALGPRENVGRLAA